MNDIETQVIKLVAKHLDKDPNEIKLESKFSDDLGADSLDLVELIMAFEEGFEMEIPDNAAEKIVRVQDAVEFIQKHQQADS